ncbi:hypothetical protein Tco_0000625 [Tanacetum coccineum]
MLQAIVVLLTMNHSGILVLPLDKTESIIYLRNLKSLSLLQLVPVRLFGTGQAAHIHEEKNREGVILLKLYYWKLGRAIMVDLKSRIPAMPIIQCEKLRQKQARRGLLPIYLDREEGGGSCGSPARPSLFYFEDPSEEAFRTRKRRLGTRIGSVVSAVAGPSPSAEMALFFVLFVHRGTKS